MAESGSAQINEALPQFWGHIQFLHLGNLFFSPQIIRESDCPGSYIDINSNSHLFKLN